MNRLMVLARIGGQRVAFDAASIEAVSDIASVTPVPFAPPHILGLSAVRSQIVTVVDSAAAVGSGRSEPPGRALLASVAGHRYALRVDAVDDVASVALAEPVSPASGECGWAGASIGRVALEGGFALMLDPARVVAACRD